ncbi:hypothetical protein HZB94_04735 [Candidatus Falkowbacteria bacterium]|nr:hypothetical protein [Candidatus Falkowbacteria bacterium]
MESNHNIAIEEIYIPAKDAKDTYLCEDFIIYPEGKEIHGGYLLGILELRATNVPEGEKIAQTIINNLKDNYYNQINSSPDPQKLNLETIFEYALQKTNAAISEMIQIGHINLILENLHYVIAVAKPNLQAKDIDFFFTQRGLIQANLLHRTKQNNYKIINIIENTPRFKEEATEKLKIFASTLSGKIYHHDALYLATEIFGNYIPSHKVNKIISANDLGTAVGYFKNLINNVRNNSYLTYCAIFIKLEEKQEITGQTTSQKSINQLISTTERTEKYLTPTFAINIFGFLRKAVVLFGRLFKGKDKLQGPKINTKGLGLIKKISGAGKLFFGFFCNSFKNIASLFSVKEKSVKTTNAANNGLSEPGRNKKFRVNKIALAVFLGVILIVAGIVFGVQRYQKSKTEEAAYAVQLQTIKELLNNAQVNLIYKNESESLALIKQAEGLIETLPQKNNNQKANLNELARQSSTIKNKLLHVTKLIPQLIAEATREAKPTGFSSVQKLGDNILLTAKSNALSTVKISQKQFIEDVFSEYGDLYFSVKDEARIMFLTNQNKVLEYNGQSQKLEPRSIDWGGKLQSQIPLLYNNNLYIIDPGGQQIYKYRAADKDFSVRAEWLKDKAGADISKATSGTIDGNIWIGTADGGVYKFYTGKLENFDLKSVEPALKKIIKIYTSANLDNLYLLEEGEKRIVLINKNGAFVGQFLFETLDDSINDFTIENNIIYFASGGKIYQAELNN